MKIHQQVEAVSFSYLPPDHPSHFHFCVTVRWRGNDRWAVTVPGDMCISRQGVWTYETRPSERTDEWLDEHRFTFDEARDLAKAQLDGLECNGNTVQDVFDLDAADIGG